MSTRTQPSRASQLVPMSVHVLQRINIIILTNLTYILTDQTVMMHTRSGTTVNVRTVHIAWSLALSNLDLQETKYHDPPYLP
jgi:hypothetical protein